MLRPPIVSFAALLAFASSCVAAAAQGGPPVSISSCVVLRAAPARAVYPNYWYPYYGLARFPRLGAPVTDGLAITYQNVGTDVADRVAFDVNYRGQRDEIVDVGKFSPNVSIAHTFGNFEGLAFLGQTPNSCTVAAVRFVDGRVWHAKHMRMQAR
jgi:hypothetical protein